MNIQYESGVRRGAANMRNGVYDVPQVERVASSLDYLRRKGVIDFAFDRDFSEIVVTAKAQAAEESRSA